MKDSTKILEMKVMMKVFGANIYKLLSLVAKCSILYFAGFLFLGASGELILQNDLFCQTPV